MSFRTKPNKPYPTFPLTAHPNGQWCKKIRGQLRFFGVWSDPEIALSRYHEAAADLHAGRTPPSVPQPDYCTVKELVNRFLAYQTGRVASGQIGARWFEDCCRVLRHFARQIGSDRPAERLSAPDFLEFRPASWSGRSRCLVSRIFRA